MKEGRLGRWGKTITLMYVKGKRGLQERDGRKPIFIHGPKCWFLREDAAIQASGKKGRETQLEGGEENGREEGHINSKGQCIEKQTVREDKKESDTSIPYMGDLQRALTQWMRRTKREKYQKIKNKKGKSGS